MGVAKSQRAFQLRLGYRACRAMASVAPSRPADTLAAARTRTLVVLWTTYGSFYLCRANFGPVRLSMQSALGLTALEMGVVLGTVKVGYALGQLVNGQLTERFGPRRILGAGMVGSAVATLLIAAIPTLAHGGALGAGASALAGAVSSALAAVGVEAGAGPVLGLLLALAFLNGWFQAGGWPPCVKVAARWFPPEHRGFTMGVLGTSLTLGSALAIAVVGFLLWAVGGWRVAFVIPAFLLLASFVHTALRLREHPPQSGDPSAVAPGDAPIAADRLPVSVALRETLLNGKIWILALGLFGVDAVRYGFLDWAPGHLAEAQQSGAWASAMKTAVFPLAGALGALSSGWITDRFFESRRAPVCAILLGSVAALTVAYRGVVALGPTPTVICLALVGFCLYGAQILLVGTAAQDFARRGATAAAAGFVDFTGHVGAFSGDVVTGVMLKRHGWAGAILWWACAAFVAAALVATLWRARPGDAHSGDAARAK
jgi:OPA family glycerol-3-phosphate transporter-like MFS transporter